jgi:hypothetical protein
MSGLVHVDLVPSHGEPIAAKIVRAGQARALRDFAEEVEAHAKQDLIDAAQADIEAAGGGGFSRTIDGVRATLSDPQLKPKIVDQPTFGDWWAAKGFPHDVTARVEIVDQATATQLLKAVHDGTITDPTQALNDLAETLRATINVTPPDDALDILTSSGAFTTDQAGLIDTTTGEIVPGVACHRARQTLSVTPDKSAKARNRHAILNALGLEQLLTIEGAA